MKRDFNSIALNVLFWVTAYFGLYEHINGAYNVLVFIIWISFFFSIGFLTEKGKETLIKSCTSRSHLYKLFNFTDIILTLILVWFDHWFLGILIIFTSAFVESGWSDIIEKREKLLQDA